MNTSPELTDYLLRARALLRQHGLGERLEDWAERHWPVLSGAFSSHGDAAIWEQALAVLPTIEEARLQIADVVRLSATPPLGAAPRAALSGALRKLQPWRKGPFDLFGIEIDAEWRSDQKWRRLAAHISDLDGRRILDVGCGNGYYAWRMLGAGARMVLGLDPGLLAVNQFRAVHRYQNDAALAVLPLPSAALDVELGCFDTVFSMGVLYHQRQPTVHLAELRRALIPGGELVLESLVIEGHGDAILIPPGRYARMRNVWSLPCPDLLDRWLADAGFVERCCVDVTVTTSAEQRRSDWMRFHSLADFLAPGDPSRTVEGHPAPRRAIIVARKA